MTELFWTLLDRSIAAGWLVLAILLLRLLFRRAPKALFPLLWGLVGLRLLLPETLKSDLSLAPERNRVVSAAHTAVTESGGVHSPAIGYVWAAGAALLLLYALVSALRLRAGLKTAVRLSGNVYQSEAVQSPFVFGLFAPRIYVPFHLDAQSLDSVIAHERAHIRRGDHLLKPAAFLLLALYWFHPLLWAAYWQLDRDLELACDEHVVRGMDDSRRAAYAQALLSFSAERRLSACPLCFGGRALKRRVRCVLDYRKPSVRVKAAAALLIPLLALCFLTGPKPNREGAAIPEPVRSALMEGERLERERQLLGRDLAEGQRVLRNEEAEEGEQARREREAQLLGQRMAEEQQRLYQDQSG